MKRSILLFALFLSACSSNTNVLTEIPTKQTLSWKTIHMNHSGGIMGLSRTVEISSNGDAVVTDDYGSKKITFQLSTDELKRLNGLISALNLSSPPSLRPGVCADCFVYDIQIDLGASKPFHATVDDVSLPDSGLGDLVTFLRGLIDRGLQK